MLENIVIGKTYRYTQGFPINCHGHLYVPLRMIKDVPTYQQKVLVEALTGPDKGELFVCSVNNFKIRYEEVPEEPIEEKVAGTETTGSGV